MPISHKSILNLSPVFLLILITILTACTDTSNPQDRKRAGGVGGQGRADWVLEIWSSEMCADPGDNLTIRATVTNTSSQKLTSVDLKDKPALDMVITEDKRTARWSDGKTLTHDWARLELGPHESKTIEMPWQVGTGGSRGAVVIEATFTDDPADSRGPVRAIGQVLLICPNGWGP